MHIYILILFFYLAPGLLLASQESGIDSLIHHVQTIQYDYPDSAIKILKKSIQDYPELNDLLYADLNYYLAYIYYMKGNYPESQSKYMMAYQLYDSLNEQEGRAKALAGRGLIQLGREHYMDAILVFRKALTINISIKNNKAICSNYLNIGICLYKLNHTPEAFDQLHKSLNLSTLNEYTILKIMATNHLGYAHLTADNYDSAQHYFEEVYENNEASKWEKSFTLAGLAQVSLNKNNLSQSIDYGKEGLLIANQLNAQWDLVQLINVLSKANEKDGQYKKALEYAHLYKNYSDSLLNKAKNRELNYVELQQTKLENEKLSGDKELIAANAKIYKYSNVALVVFMLFLIVILLIYRKYAKQRSKYYDHLSDLNKQIIVHKNKIEQQNIGLNELNSSKTKLFSILAHDLRSPMISIQQVLGLNQQEKLSEKDFRNLVSMLETQVTNVNHMLNDLLRWANDQMDGMQIHPLPFSLPEIVEQNINTFLFMSSEKQIKILHKKPADAEIYADVEHSKIIINNLINNAIKFTPIAGEIEISYTESFDKWTIHIKDSGIGMDDATKMILLSEAENRSYSRSGTREEMGTGLGLLLVKQFANYNNAILDIKSQEKNGTTFSVSFPKPDASKLNHTA